MTVHVQDGTTGDDPINTPLLGSGDILVSHTLEGNDTVNPFSARYQVWLGSGDDRFTAGAGGVAYGEDGDDWFYLLSRPAGQNHVLDGGNGDDRMVAIYSDANVTLRGGAGTDHLITGATVGGAQTFNGGAGFDLLEFTAYAPGSTGIALSLATGTGSDASGLNDTYFGIEAVEATSGNDQVTGNRLANLLIGGIGADTLGGGGGDDLLIGDGRTDEFFWAYTGTHLSWFAANALPPPDHMFDPLQSSAFATRAWRIDTGDLGDRLYGGAGNDVLIGGLGPDTLDGGSGIDWVSYADGDGVRAGLDGIPFLGPDAVGDVLRNIENLLGSAFDDRLDGNGLDNELRGGDGEDMLYGRGGNDSLLGGDGADTLSGGSGDDLFIGGAGNDTFVGGAGHDTFGFDATVDEGSDRINYFAALDTLAFDGITDLSQLSFTDVGNDLRIDWALGSVTIANFAGHQDQVQILI